MTTAATRHGKCEGGCFGVGGARGKGDDVDDALWGWFLVRSLAVRRGGEGRVGGLLPVARLGANTSGVLCFWVDRAQGEWQGLRREGL